MQSPYTILGVAADAPLPAIRRAFHRLALELHPDKLRAGATHAERERSEEAFKAAANAYELLSDPVRRAAFDAGRGDPSASPCSRSSRDIFAAYFGAWEEGGGGDAPAVAVVEPEEVFNLPLFEGYLVLDPRPAAERAVAAVATSLAVDAREVARSGWGAWFAAAVDDFSHERCSPVVVLGDGPGGGAELAASLAAYLAAAPEGPLLPAAAARAVAALRASRARVRVVRGGTAALLGAFPLLAAAWGDSEPTPHAIAPGVLLGSRAVASTPRTLRAGLGVTHALVAAGAAQVPGVATLALDVADAGEAGGEDAARLAAAWQQGCEFIEAARAAGGTVLVQVHGRSRSAGFALAWLARAHGLPAPLAARVLQRQCPSVDWSLAAVPQLAEWLRAQAPAARLEQ